MGAEAAMTGPNGNKKPTALPPVRARPREARVVDDGAGGSTPSLGAPVAVPFLWEDAPGRPKPHSAATVGGDHDATKAPQRLLMPPLKLPPRLQHVPSSAADHHPLSPRTVLQGPYYGCTGAGAGGARRPPPRLTDLRRVGSFRRAPLPTSGGAGTFFSSYRRKAADKKKGGGREHSDASAHPDASCSSPSSSASSSSSSFASFFSDDRHGDRRWRADQEEEDESGNASVRITRFRRNRSLPTMTTSHLWASIRKSVKQIAPWS